MRSIVRVLVLGLLPLLLAGCMSGLQTDQGKAKESALTSGMTKKYIKPGVTTQQEVLEIFGPPNLITSNNGRDVWTYDKMSRNFSDSGGYLTIFLAGWSGHRSQSSSRSAMLMVYFDDHDVVKDYRLHVSQF